MNLTVHVWRQAGPSAPGKMVTYKVSGISEHASFLEMLDVLNEQLDAKGEEPIAFDHDCREGICGMCSLMINGRPHGGDAGTTTCQLHMRRFKDGDEIFVEPWRAAAFPVIKDLSVDRGAFDRIQPPAASSPPTPARRPTPTRCRCPRKTPTAPWTPRRASAAARASRPAPTARPCCSSAPS
jgi:succinate dehydrogenase/fumarate reductase-like Fe-S protein